MEEFLKPMGPSQYRLAKEIDVPAQRISVPDQLGVISGLRQKQDSQAAGVVDMMNAHLDSLQLR